MKNMKKIISTALITTSLLAFVGCESTTTKVESNEDFYIAQQTTMVVIRTGGVMDSPGIYHLVDKSTGVMYLYTTDSGRGGLTVMLDADGKPLNYRVWCEANGINPDEVIKNED